MGRIAISKRTMEKTRAEFDTTCRRLIVRGSKGASQGGEEPFENVPR